MTVLNLKRNIKEKYKSYFTCIHTTHAAAMATMILVKSPWMENLVFYCKLIRCILCWTYEDVL